MEKCNLCDREFKTEEALKQHKKNRHSTGYTSAGGSGKKWLIWLAVIVVLVGLFYVGGRGNEGSDRYDEFAGCLADAGAEMYGAWWCHNCESQLDMFERSDKVPYTECAPPSGQGQYRVCQDKNIQSYPTWIFEDGSRVTGVQSFETLAEKTGCALPA